MCIRDSYMPFVFDRWKKYVALRKLFAYKFRLVANATNNVRADLQAAFNFWKHKPLQLRADLSRLNTDTLTEISLMTTKKVGDCAEKLYEN